MVTLQMKMNAEDSTYIMSFIIIAFVSRWNKNSSKYIHEEVTSTEQQIKQSWWEGNIVSSVSLPVYLFVPSSVCLSLSLSQNNNLACNFRST